MILINDKGERVQISGKSIFDITNHINYCEVAVYPGGGAAKKHVAIVADKAAGCRLTNYIFDEVDNIATLDVLEALKCI